MSSSSPDKTPGRISTTDERIAWPPFRSDVLALSCLLVATYCMLEHIWPLVLLGALSGAIFCGLAPRLRGAWRLRVWGAELRAHFRSDKE